MPSILLTGATGTVGREVAKALIQRNIPFRVANYHAPVTDEKEVYLDLQKPETFLPALMGVEKIFLIRPPRIADVKKYFCPFVQAARQQGVKQIVFLSAMGVERQGFAPPAKIEKYIRDAQIGYTFLRPSFFMQNLVTAHLDEIRQDNIIYLPSGKGKTSLIDARDIGEAGAVSLLDEQHMNKAYTLTGSQSLSYYEVAKIFTDVLGRQITYANPSLFQFRKHMLSKGLPSQYVSVILGVYLIAILGVPRAVTPDLGLLIGHAPKTMREFVFDYRDQFASLADSPVHI